MTPKHLGKVLLEKWRIIALCIALAMALAVLDLVVTTPVYKSTATVVAGVRAPETIGPQSVAEQLSSDYLLTQEDILKSDRVARQVVTDTGLANAPGVIQQYGWEPTDGALPDFIASKLRNGLLVDSSVTNSRVMEISFLSGNPQFAAAMANAFANAFIDVNVQLQADPARRTVASYTRQLDALSGKLHEMQAQLVAKEGTLDIVAGKGENDPDSARLNALSAQLAAAQAQSAAASAHAGAGALPDTMASGVVQGLQTEIARLEAQRSQMSATAGPNNPDYRQLVAQIAGLRGQLSSQEALIRKSAAAAAAQAQAMQSGLNGAVTAQRGRVTKVRAAQSEVSVMQQDIANLQASYDQIAQRRAQLQVLDNTGQTNLSLLSPATPSDTPVLPRRLLTLALALMTGVVAGILLTLTIEFFDRRIRFSSEIESWLGIPDLGAIRISPPRPMRLPRMVTGLLPNTRAQ
jgi:uncharacterized protein involved in exopolysaccharide biosynthesis